jgi:tRNA (adenine37-N6)-methyltransferase
MNIEPVAYLHGDFGELFGIPRQSGLCDEIISEIVFERKYQNPDYIRGIEQFSHLYLLWQFSENLRDKVSATVRPPRLGGNKRIGVFASRSPFRPNAIGLSIVRLLKIRHSADKGEILVVSGADLLDGTPIYDIKPYIPVFDSVPGANGGYTDITYNHRLEIHYADGIEQIIPINIKALAEQILSQDVRPGYQSDPLREYGIKIRNYNIKFRVEGNVLTVTTFS